jgi:hypothetical protein
VKGLKSLTNSKTEEQIKDFLFSSLNFLRTKFKKETSQLQSTIRQPTCPTITTTTTNQQSPTTTIQQPTCPTITTTTTNQQIIEHK